MNSQTFRPSSLEKLEKCPKYRSSDFGNEDAIAFGHNVHKAIETKDLKHCADEEQEEHAKRGIQYEAAFLRSLTSVDEVFHEYRLEHSLISGTADLVVISESGKKLYIRDWKTGKMSIPDARTNLQGQAYGLALTHAFPRFESINIGFFFTQTGDISEATFYPMDMEASKNRIQGVYWEHRNPYAQPRFDEDVCEWCGNKAECPIMNGAALVVAGKLGLPVPAAFDPGKPVSEKDRALAHILAGLLTDWASQVKKANTRAVIEDGLEIPFFSLMTRAGNPSVESPSAVYQILSEKYPEFKLEDFLEICKLSLGNLVTRLQAILKEGGEKVSKKDLTEFLEKDLLKDNVSRGEPITFLTKERNANERGLLSQIQGN